jgi:AAA+ superfamily predicted ATPase
MTEEYDDSAMPEWFDKGVAEPFKAGIASVYIVHGDINCLVRNPNVKGEPKYVPLRRFIETVFEERDMVLYYNIAAGAWAKTPDQWKLFLKVAGVDEPKADAKGAADPIAAAKAGLAAKRGIPREPEACLPLFQKALRAKLKDGVAVIIEAAHTIAPESGPGGAALGNDRQNIERFRIWGRSEAVRKNGNIAILLTDEASKVSKELRQTDSEIRTVFIPKPTRAERKAFLAWSFGLATAPDVEKGLRKGKGVDTDVLAHATQGMSLRQISELLVRATSAETPLGLAFVKEKKREILSSEYGEIMEVIEPDRGLEDIGGHDHIKGYFGGVLKAIRENEVRLVPMGVTLMGPPGTGKTAIVEALAKEAGFNFVRIKNVRSMWVGESEARMEKLVYGLRALAPVVVMNDEADLAEAGRESPKGDSGVSERIMKMWMELLSDPRIRGQIIVINCTNRPDRIDPALKRSGRSDERILMPMPSADDRKLIFPVMFRRHKIPCAIADFAPFAKASEAMSGADIEAIVLRSFSFANEDGKKKVDAKALNDALRDFIPSANMAQIDAMTMAGLVESSSRRLLPPHVERIVEEIRARGLVAGVDEVVAQLRDRKILEPAKK